MRTDGERARPIRGRARAGGQQEQQQGGRGQGRPYQGTEGHGSRAASAGPAILLLDGREFAARLRLSELRQRSNLAEQADRVDQLPLLRDLAVAALADGQGGELHVPTAR